jgi:hypothetical protein
MREFTEHAAKQFGMHVFILAAEMEANKDVNVSW